MQWLANTFLGGNEESRDGSSTIFYTKNESKFTLFSLRYFYFLLILVTKRELRIGQELGVDQATVSRTVRSEVDRTVAQANNRFKFPTSNQEITRAKELWQSKYRFLTAVGVLDCTHVDILKPRAHGDGDTRDEYINRKVKPMLNVQATCEAKEIFTSVLM